jgi:hypothetical protein
LVRDTDVIVQDRGEQHRTAETSWTLSNPTATAMVNDAALGGGSE